MHALKVLPIICIFFILMVCGERAVGQALDGQNPVVNIENGSVIEKIAGNSRACESRILPLVQQ